MAFKSNLTNNPKICLARPEICLDSKEVSRDGDGSLIGRFSWPLEKFSELVLADINTHASRVSYLGRYLPEALGFALTDSPWSSDLAVTSQGDACGGIDEYEYSYGSPTGLFDCNRVWDVRPSPASCPPPGSRAPYSRPCARQPDGSVHGNPQSYGRYDGMNVSLSMMLVDDGHKSWRRLCDSPQPPQAAITPCTKSPSAPCSTCLLGHTCAPMQAAIYSNWSDSATLEPTVSMWVYENFIGTLYSHDEYFENKSWTPGVCYHLRNITLNGGANFRAFSQPLRNCMELSPMVNALFIGTFLLFIFRILLQLVWFNRCDAKRDQGIIVCLSIVDYALTRVSHDLRVCNSCDADRKKRAKYVAPCDPFDRYADSFLPLQLVMRAAHGNLQPRQRV